MKDNNVSSKESVESEEANIDGGGEESLGSERSVEESSEDSSSHGEENKDDENNNDNGNDNDNDNAYDFQFHVRTAEEQLGIEEFKIEENKDNNDGL